MVPGQHGGSWFARDGLDLRIGAAHLGGMQTFVIVLIGLVVVGGTIFGFDRRRGQKFSQHFGGRGDAPDIPDSPGGPRSR